MKSERLNAKNRSFSATIVLALSACSPASCSTSQNRKSTVRRPFENQKSTVTISGQLRLVTPLNAYERHPTILFRQTAALPSFRRRCNCNRNQTQRVAVNRVGCGRMHPVASDTIFSAEPQQLQLPACRLYLPLYRRLYRRLWLHLSPTLSSLRGQTLVRLENHHLPAGKPSSRPPIVHCRPALFQLRSCVSGELEIWVC